MQGLEHSYTSDGVSSGRLHYGTNGLRHEVAGDGGGPRAVRCFSGRPAGWHLRYPHRVPADENPRRMFRGIRNGQVESPQA